MINIMHLINNNALTCFIHTCSDEKTFLQKFLEDSLGTGNE